MTRVNADLNRMTAFISELVRAANIVETIGDSEMSRLLEHAYYTICDIRKGFGPLENGPGRDPVKDILTISRSVGTYSDSQVKTALLEAAGVIRGLKIILNVKDEVTRKGTMHSAAQPISLRNLTERRIR